MICDPFGAFVPGAGCSSTTVPSCDGSLVGRSSTTGAKPACWSCVCAAVSSLPTTSGTVTGGDCAGVVCGCARVVCFGCAGVVAAGAVVDGCELDGAPAETLIRTRAPPCAFSPGFGFCATTVPAGCSEGTRCVVTSNPADFRREAASDSLW